MTETRKGKCEGLCLIDRHVVLPSRIFFEKMAEIDQPLPECCYVESKPLPLNPSMARGAVKTYTQIAEEEAQRLRPFQEKLRTHNRAELEAMHAKMVEAVVDAKIQ